MSSRLIPGILSPDPTLRTFNSQGMEIVAKPPLEGGVGLPLGTNTGEPFYDDSENRKVALMGMDESGLGFIKLGEMDIGPRPMTVKYSKNRAAQIRQKQQIDRMMAGGAPVQAKPVVKQAQAPQPSVQKAAPTVPNWASQPKPKGPVVPQNNGPIPIPPPQKKVVRFQIPGFGWHPAKYDDVVESGPWLILVLHKNDEAEFPKVFDDMVTLQLGDERREVTVGDTGMMFEHRGFRYRVFMLTQTDQDDQ